MDKEEAEKKAESLGEDAGQYESYWADLLDGHWVVFYGYDGPDDFYKYVYAK